MKETNSLKKVMMKKSLQMKNDKCINKGAFSKLAGGDYTQDWGGGGERGDCYNEIQG